MSFVLLYLAAGIAAGILSGLFGLGGGVIIVPILLLVFTLQGIADSVSMHMAVASSLAIIVTTSIASIRAHARRGGVRWELALSLVPGIVVGALAGALLAAWISGEALRIIFATFLAITALRMGFAGEIRRALTLPGRAGMSLVGSGIGLLSALVGIGGGSLTVPFLAKCGVAMREAVGTSAACGLPIALAGTIGFMISGWNHADLPNWTSGYVFWPAVLAVAITSTLLAPVGAMLAYRLPATLLRRLFAVLLALMAIRLLFDAL
ncbi:sulfite exporter TauE/SafE family protein [Methylonatrum kenyense]|uniref:sulfite exporter TauE/SafE family protein n=1 Tax=Methylonatrum kenyense TaxID=455253 RepID=UPI0020BFCDFE|nr:sulfite exporter TauE/SafE family protein [Methylonatrum kenyense]MCK8515391.1 sulfite exporter TauE/SafE family protein [Methylonatrum kenyense]